MSLPLACCLGLCLAAMVTGCSLEKPAPRAIRGHLRNVSGVAHGEPARRGPRYCSACHGSDLMGGSAGQPSCYQCHGRNWDDHNLDTRFAPGNHSELRGRYYHDPGFSAPSGACVSCHGAALAGNEERGTPSCLLCHDRLWE